MNKLFKLIIGLAVVAASMITAPAAMATPGTFTGGVVSTDTTLTLADSPYVISSTIQVMEGVTLTVEPGVSIRGPYSTLFRVFGNLNLVGTQNSPILLESYGRFFDGQSLGVIDSEYARYEGHGTAPLETNGWGDASYYFRNCDFIDLYDSSIGSWNNLIFEKNVFSNSRPIRLNIDNANVVTFNNNLFLNPAISTNFVGTYATDTPWLDFYGYEYGEFLMTGNSFLNGPYKVISNVDFQGQLNADSNFWGTTDQTAIAGMVTDNLHSPAEIITTNPLQVADPSTPTGLRWEIEVNFAVTPLLGDTVREEYSITVPVQNYVNSGFNWRCKVTAGFCNLRWNAQLGYVFVNYGLDPGQSTTIRIFTSRSGVSDSVASITTSTLLPRLTPTFNQPIPTVGGFIVFATNYDSAYTWESPEISTGTVTRTVSGSVVMYVVSGLNNGQTIRLTQRTSRLGHVSGASYVYGTSIPKPLVYYLDKYSVAPGGLLLIKGTGFGLSDAFENVVKIGSTTCVVVTSTASTITVRVPANTPIAASSLTVSVSTLTSTPVPVSVTAPHRVTAVSATTTAVGQNVTITGMGFTDSLSDIYVYFNGSVVPATVVSGTATSLVVTVPEGATTGQITVKINGLSVTLSRSITIAAMPTIASINTEKFAPGQTVIINGSGFSKTAAKNIVKFGTQAGVVKSATTTQLTVVVPKRATLGENDISVSVSGLISDSKPVTIQAALR